MLGGILRGWNFRWVEFSWVEFSWNRTALPSASSSVEFRPPVKLTICNLNKKKRNVDTNDELIQVALAKLQEKKNDDDDSSAFGVVVATQIKKMDKKQATIATKLINATLYQGAMNMLETTTQIVTVTNIP